MILIKKNIKPKPKLLIILCIFLINIIHVYYYSGAFANIRAIISNQGDSDTLTTDDIIELQITTDSNYDGNIDLTPLTKNFDIVSKGKQISHSIINGNSSSRIQLLIGLRAKESGSLTIPAITIGNDRSNELTVKVVDPSADHNLAQEIFVNVEADNQSLYLQTPIKITVNIYLSSAITVRDLELNNPEHSDYILFKLNENNKQVFYKNIRYNLFQVSYLGFYNKTGNLSLPKFTLSGLKLKSHNSSNDLLSLYQQQWSPFTRNNPELKINILEKPESFNNIPWLTAENISVTQAWTKDNTTNDISKLSVGDAIQRTITINGKNVPAEYLPTLYDQKLSNDPNNINAANESYKVYIDKPELTNKITDGKLYSTLAQKITYIITKDGKLELPSHKILWWNYKTKTIEQATIPNKLFNITAPTTSKQNKNPSQFPASIEANNNYNKPNNDIITNQNITLSNESATTIKQIVNSKLFYILIAIIIVLLLIVLYLIILLKARNNETTGSTRSAKKLKVKTTLNEINKQFNLLKNSAKSNDPQSTYKNLIELANIIYNSTKNISNNSDGFNTLKQNLQADSQDNINNLTSALYSNNSTNWDSAYFIKTVIPEIKKIYTSLLKHPPNKEKNHSLPDLYPE